MLLESLSKRVIAFHPVLSKVLGGIEETLFFQQINFWSDKGEKGNGIVYKTAKEIEDETGLTPRVQARVKKNLVKLGVLRTWVEQVRGVPTCHYQIDYDRLQKRVLHFYKLSKTSISESTYREKKAFPSKQGNAPFSGDRGTGGKTYKTPQTERVIRHFAEKCLKTLGINVSFTVKDHRLVIHALSHRKDGGRLSEEQLYDLVDEWFKMDKPDEHVIQLSRALSTNQINGYKVRNNVRA
jgi:hypothetical protein